MKMTNKEYEKYVAEVSPKSKMPIRMLWAFLVGGAICTLGQALISLYLHFGLEEKAAGTASSASLIFLAALFTALGLYDKLAKYAGAGTLVPITGFSNAMVSPAMEFKSDDRVIIGTSQKHHEIKVDVLV